METIAKIKEGWLKQQIKLLESKGLSKAQIARDLGIKPQQLSNVLNGSRGITDKFIDAFILKYDINQFDLFGDTSIHAVTPAHTFSLQTDQNIKIQNIPLYDLSATAGLMAIFNDVQTNPEDYLRVPNLPPVDGALYVRGESMTPLLKSGDIVIFKKLELSLDSILWGQIYLLSFDAGGDTFTVVKYIQKSERSDYIRLVSQNSRFEPKDIPLSSIRALALVKASITFHTIE